MDTRLHRAALVLTTAIVAAGIAAGAQEDHPPADAEGAFDVAVAPDGSVWVVGQTRSPDFPTRRAWRPTSGGGLDGFVVRLRPGGRGIVFATYLGGSGDDRALSVAVDDAGHGYVAGTTRSDDFPTRRALQPRGGGQADVFLVKLTPRGDPVYSTYFGGGRDEGVGFVAVDGRGRPTLAGVTRSPDLPTRAAAQRRHGGGADAFVARLHRSGRRLQYSTYLGGEGFDAGLGVVTDAAGGAHVAGRTSSASLPGEIVDGPPARAPGVVGAAPPGAADEAAADAFVATLARGGAVRWVRRLAGSGGDLATSIARGPGGELWAMGRTTSADFPLVEPIQSEFGGVYDGWVARLSGTGRVERSTYLGGSAIDFGLVLGDAIAVDGRGRVTLIGKTTSADLPVRRAWQPTTGGGYDVWVARIDGKTDRLMFTSYLGGRGHEFGLAAALDGRGRAWLAGKTGSDDFPVLDPLQRGLRGDYDVWIARLARGGRRLTWSTYLGGSD